MGQVKQDWTVHSVYTLLVHSSDFFFFLSLFEIFQKRILYSRSLRAFYFRIFVNHDTNFRNVLFQDIC